MKLLVSFVILSVCGASCMSQIRSTNGTFTYFAFGSNMLSSRIHFYIPSAVFLGPAVLKDYRLDFNQYVDVWNGAIATIMRHKGREVWGALWNIDNEHMEALDRQEGVSYGYYYGLNATVTSSEGNDMLARTYALYEDTMIPPYEVEVLPRERRPSNTYLMMVHLGAIESKLPADYIGWLFTFFSNGRNADDLIRDYHGYPFGPEKDD